MKRSLPLIAVLALAGCASTGGHAVSPAPESSTATFPPLFMKARGCVLPDDAWQDENRTLVLDGEGKNEAGDADKADARARECVFEKLGTPQSIIVKVGQTRALDGRQEDSADGIEYSWTYHPDNGLDMIITQGQA